MDVERAKATIRKLLNLANDESAAKGEIENAMRFAARLMEQHQLSDDDLSEVDSLLFDLERAEMLQQSQQLGGAKVSAWEQHAASFVCKLVGGVEHYADEPVVVRNPAGIVQLDDNGRPLMRSVIWFYGIAEDVEIARQVFAEVIVTIAAMARLKWGGVYRGDGREYCEGFVDGLHTQLRDDAVETRRIAQQAGGTALLAMESRQAIVEKKRTLAQNWLRNTCGVKLSSRSFGGASYCNDNARQDGHRDGERHAPNSERRRKLTAAK
jgi:hypothetical protein